MKIKIILVILCSATLFAAHFKEYNKALESGKDIAVLIHGNKDWNYPGIEFLNKVWQHSEVNRAPVSFVAIEEVDNLATPEKQREVIKEVRGKFNVGVINYPAVVFLDKTGRVVDINLNVVNMTPKAFMNYLKECIAKRTERDKYFSDAEKANVQQKIELMGKGLAILDFNIVKSYYRDKLNDLDKLEGSSKSSGYTAVYNYHYLGLVEGTVINEAVKNKNYRAIESINDLLNNNKRPIWQQQELLAMKYAILKAEGKKDQAKKMLEDMVKLDPKTHMGIGAIGRLKREFGVIVGENMAKAKKEKKGTKKK